MKRTLTLYGLVICAYTYVYFSTALVYFSSSADVIHPFGLGKTAMLLVLSSLFIVAPAHFLLVRKAVRQNVIDWPIAVPYLLIPYMLGVIVQGLFL